MSIPVPAVAGLAALLAFGSAGSAAAQSAPDGRAWTDPPARGAAVAPAVSMTKAAETAPVASSVAAPEPRAAVSKPRLAVSGAHAGDPRPGSVVPKPRAVASKPARAAHAAHVATIRRWPVAVARPQPDFHRAPVRMARTPDLRPVRYGFVAPPPPPPFADDIDSRARRIRQAEAAGYLVVRRTTLAAPDGRLLYGYRPYGADDFDD